MVNKMLTYYIFKNTIDTNDVLCVSEGVILGCRVWASCVYVYEGVVPLLGVLCGGCFLFVFEYFVCVSFCVACLVVGAFCVCGGGGVGKG